MSEEKAYVDIILDREAPGLGVRGIGQGGRKPRNLLQVMLQVPSDCAMPSSRRLKRRGIERLGRVERIELGEMMRIKETNVPAKFGKLTTATI